MEGACPIIFFRLPGAFAASMCTPRYYLPRALRTQTVVNPVKIDFQRGTEIDSNSTTLIKDPIPSKRKNTSELEAAPFERSKRGKVGVVLRRYDMSADPLTNECSLNDDVSESSPSLPTKTNDKAGLRRPPPKLKREDEKTGTRDLLAAGDLSTSAPAKTKSLLKHPRATKGENQSRRGSGGGVDEPPKKKLPPGALALMGKSGGTTWGTTPPPKGKKSFPPGALQMMSRGNQKGGLKRPPAQSLPRQDSGGRDLRQRALMMHKKMTSMMNPKHVSEPRISFVERTEAEGYAISAAFDVLDDASVVSATESKLVREVVEAILPQLKYELHEVVLENVSAVSEGTSDGGDGEEAEFEQKATREVTPVKVLRSRMQKIITDRLEDLEPDVELEEKCRKRFPFQYEVFVESAKGPRSRNEDTCCVLEHFNHLLGIDGEEMMCLGVFDGHSGQRASEYARAQLPVQIGRHEAFRGDISRAITEGFLKTDDFFLRRANDHSLDCGTTATCIFITHDTITVGNCGDARVMFCRSGGEFTELVDIHNASRESEKLRVQAAGGAVVWYGTWRVNGVLAVSRSIGDRAHCKVVIAEPEIKTANITSDAEFLLAATDGLWDVMDCEEVRDFVLETARTKGRRNVIKYLLREVYERVSKDNTTIVVVFFGEDKHPCEDYESTEESASSDEEESDAPDSSPSQDRSVARVVWTRPSSSK